MSLAMAEAGARYQPFWVQGREVHPSAPRPCTSAPTSSHGVGVRWRPRLDTHDFVWPGRQYRWGRACGHRLWATKGFLVHASVFWVLKALKRRVERISAR
jgi:hypothetical protein